MIILFVQWWLSRGEILYIRQQMKSQFLNFMCWKQENVPVFCCKILCLGIHVVVTLKCTNYLKIVEDHVHLIMAMMFPYDSSLFQFDIAPWYTTKIVKEWFKKHEKRSRCCMHFQIPQISVRLSIYWMCWSGSKGISKVRQPCQSTLMGEVCAELRHSDRNLRTAWFEKGGFKIGIKNNTGFVSL